MSPTGPTTEIRERNPKNQQKDVESRCFLEEIPRQKECASHKRLASTSQEEKLRSCCLKFQGFSAQAAIFSSRIHPCLSDFLRLSPSVSLSLSLTLLPCFLSPVSHRPSLFALQFPSPSHLLISIEPLRWTPSEQYFISRGCDLQTLEPTEHTLEKTVYQIQPHMQSHAILST